MRQTFKCGHSGKGAYCHKCKPNTKVTEEEAQRRYKDGKHGARELRKWTTKGWIKPGAGEAGSPTKA
jgi:hypothetical protein